MLLYTLVAPPFGWKTKYPIDLKIGLHIPEHVTMSSKAGRLSHLIDLKFFPSCCLGVTLMRKQYHFID